MISSVISVEVKHLFKTKIHHKRSLVKLFMTVPQEDINNRTDNSVVSKDQVIVIVFGRIKGMWGTWLDTPPQIWKTGPGRSKTTRDNAIGKIIVKLFHQLPRPVLEIIK